MKTNTVKLSDIVVNDVFYKFKKRPEIVIEYAKDIVLYRYSDDVIRLPSVEINQNNELISGWYPFLAYKMTGFNEVPVTITKTKTKEETLSLIFERNKNSIIEND